MTLEQLKEWIKVQITKHPEHKEEMLDLYSLCIDEIADGGSEWNEVQLCISSIEELLEEDND
jgi:hypothetical protein